MLEVFKPYAVYVGAFGLALVGVSKLLGGDGSGLTDVLTALGVFGIHHAVTTA